MMMMFCQGYVGGVATVTIQLLIEVICYYKSFLKFLKEFGFKTDRDSEENSLEFMRAHLSFMQRLTKATN